MLVTRLHNWVSKHMAINHRRDMAISSWMIHYYQSYPHPLRERIQIYNVIALVQSQKNLAKTM